MAIDKNGYAKELFEKIDDLFIDQVGPIGLILCEESTEEWYQELKSKGVKISLRHVPVYVGKLAAHIEEPVSKNIFINAVYELESMNPYKPR